MHYRVPCAAIWMIMRVSTFYYYIMLSIPSNSANWKWISFDCSIYIAGTLRASASASIEQL